MKKLVLILVLTLSFHGMSNARNMTKYVKLFNETPNEIHYKFKWPFSALTSKETQAISDLMYKSAASKCSSKGKNVYQFRKKDPDGYWIPDRDQRKLGYYVYRYFCTNSSIEAIAAYNQSSESTGQCGSQISPIKNKDVCTTLKDIPTPLLISGTNLKLTKVESVIKGPSIKKEEEKIAKQKRLEEERIAEQKRLEEEKIAEAKRIEEERVKAIEEAKRLEEEEIARVKRVDEERIAETKRKKEERKQKMLEKFGVKKKKTEEDKSKGNEGSKIVLESEKDYFDTCKRYGFKLGTTKFGECVLKVREFALEQEKINATKKEEINAKHQKEEQAINEQYKKKQREILESQKQQKRKNLEIQLQQERERLAHQRKMQEIQRKQAQRQREVYEIEQMQRGLEGMLRGLCIAGGC